MYNIHNDTCFELQIVQTSCLTVALWCTFLYLKIIACIMVIDTTPAYLIPYIRHVKQGDLDPSVRGLRDHKLHNVTQVGREQSMLSAPCPFFCHKPRYFIRTLTLTL